MPCTAPGGREVIFFIAISCVCCVPSGTTRTNCRRACHWLTHCQQKRSPSQGVIRKSGDAPWALASGNWGFEAENAFSTAEAGAVGRRLGMRRESRRCHRWKSKCRQREAQFAGIAVAGRCRFACLLAFNGLSVLVLGTHGAVFRHGCGGLQNCVPARRRGRVFCGALRHQSLL